MGPSSKRTLSQWESGLSDVHRDHLSPVSLLLAPSISPSHLSFHSHGSFSLIWIPTDIYITDGTSITLKHMPFTSLTVSWCSVCVCRAVWGSPIPPPNPPSRRNPSETSELPWKYYAALHCGTAAGTCWGLTSISVALSFDTQPWLNSAPLLQLFGLMKSWERA